MLDITRCVHFLWVPEKILRQRRVAVPSYGHGSVCQKVLQQLVAPRRVARALCEAISCAPGGLGSSILVSTGHLSSPVHPFSLDLPEHLVSVHTLLLSHLGHCQGLSFICYHV
jgi:hypothetical protein